MIPSGPVGVIVARSTPRSLASLRTGGLASGREDGAGVGAGAACPFISDWIDAEAGEGPGAPEAAPCPGTEAPLRGRRFVDASATPYPTRTGVRPDGSAFSDAGSVFSPAGSAGSGAWAEAGARVGSPLPGATSTVMMVAPTSTVVPSSKRSSCTTPSYGMGSSTAAFAVSTSHTTWPSATESPGCTYHLRISASVSPSPTSGILNSR